MEKSKLNTFIIIGLLFLNLATLGFVFFSLPKSHEPPMHRMQPRDRIIEQLHFDRNQIQKFEKLIEVHQSEIRKTDVALRKAKKNLYSLLTNDAIDLKIKDSLLSEVNHYQKQIEEIHFEHFEGIKSLCNESQQEDFKAFTLELENIFQANKPPRKPRP